MEHVTWPVRVPGPPAGTVRVSVMGMVCRANNREVRVVSQGSMQGVQAQLCTSAMQDVWLCPSASSCCPRGQEQNAYSPPNCHPLQTHVRHRPPNMPPSHKPKKLREHLPLGSGVVCNPSCILRKSCSSGRSLQDTLLLSECGRVWSTHPLSPSTQRGRGRTAGEDLQGPWGLLE